MLDPQLIFDLFYNFDGENKLLAVTEDKKEYRKYDIIENIKEMGF